MSVALTWSASVVGVKDGRLLYLWSPVRACFSSRHSSVNKSLACNNCNLTLEIVAPPFQESGFH